MDNNQIDINLSSDIKTDRAIPLNITLMSRDINNNQFRLSFTSNGEKIQLNDSFTVEILSVFQKTKNQVLTTAEVYGYQALWSFDTEFISGTDTVFNYVYIKKDGVPIVSADANAFWFNVGLSKIDENAGRVAESYDENYEKVLHEFELKINLTAEEWAQMADETREFVDQIKDVTVDEFVELKMGEELANLEVNYATRLTGLEAEDQKLTTQLAHTANQIINKIIPNVKKESRNFDLESKEVLAFSNNTLSNKTGFTTSNATPYSINIRKGADHLINVAMKPNNANNIEFQYFEFSFRTPNISSLTNMEMRVYPNGDSNYYNRNVNDKIFRTLTANELITVRVHKSELTPSNPEIPLLLSPDGLVELRISGLRGFEMQFYGFLGVNIKTPTILQFDDGHISVYEKAFPLMKERGIVGTFNVVPTWVGEPDRCTIAQLQEMQNAGWSICNHTNEHLDLQTLTVDAAIKDVQIAQDFLTKHGFTGSKILAPPFNSFNYDLESKLRHASLTRKFGTRLSDPLIKKEGVVYIQSKSVKKDDSFAFLRDNYSQAAEKGYYFSACYHNFEEVYPSWEYSHEISKFEQFLDFLVDQGAYFINMETFVDRMMVGDLTGQSPLNNVVDTATHRVMSINAYSATTPIADIPDGITTFPINVSGGSGFPGNYAGIVTTYKIQGNGWDRQEFYRYNSNDKWFRYTDSSGNWTPFIKSAGNGGTSSERPTQGVEVGHQYYDTILGKPIWLKSKPSTWVDSTGAIV